MKTQVRPRVGDRVRVITVLTDAMKGYVGRVGTVEAPKQMPNGCQDCVSVRFDRAKRFRAISVFFKAECLEPEFSLQPDPSDLTAVEVQKALEQLEAEESLFQPTTDDLEQCNSHTQVLGSEVCQQDQLKHLASFQGLEDSTYQQENWELEQPSLLKSIHSAKKFYEDTSLPFLSTMMSAPLTQREESGKLCMEGFHATELVALATEKDSETSTVHFGGKCSGSSNSQDQHLSSLKIQKVCDIEDLPKLFTALPATGIWGNGSVYQLPTLERPICEKEFLLLPTPTASNGEGKNYRPAGGNKLTEKLKQLNLLPSSQVLSAEVVELMQGFPMGWTSPSESSAIIQTSTCNEDKCSGELLFQSVQRSPSLESSTSTLSCENFPDRTETEDEQLCENFPKPGKTWLDPREIDLHAGTQSRDRTDWETVQRYTEQMTEGFWDWERQPLPVIFEDPEGRKYPGDAHHRTTAAVAAKVDLICVDLRSGSLIDAIMFSCEAKANREHGLPLTAKDQRRRIELFLETRDQLPEGDERRRYSSREIARYLGLSESGYRTIVNIINEREMFGKISQFDEGDRVQVVRNAATASGGYWPDGTLGKVQDIDKKKGILVVPEPTGDSWMLSHGWIHPDNLIKAPLTEAAGKISQHEEVLEADWQVDDLCQYRGVIGQIVRIEGDDVCLSLNGYLETVPIFEIRWADSEYDSVLLAQNLVPEPKSKAVQLLPDVKRNHSSPADVDDRPFTSPPPPIPINTSEICTALISNVEYLTDDQVDAVWKAIANGKPDVVTNEIAIGIQHLNSGGLLHVIEAIAHHVGAEILGDLLVHSIYSKDEVTDLCNKCLGAMDKKAFSRNRLKVEQINFSGLSDFSLKLLIKFSKRALNERHNPEYFNKKQCGSTLRRKSMSETTAPAIRCGCEKDADDEDLTLGVPAGDNEEAL